MGPEWVIGGVVGVLTLALALVWSGYGFARPAIREQEARAERAESDLALERVRRADDRRRWLAAVAAERDRLAREREVAGVVAGPDPAANFRRLLKHLGTATSGDPAPTPSGEASTDDSGGVGGVEA